MEEEKNERPGLVETIQALGYDSYSVESAGEYSGWKTVRCPFHDDRSASASVNVPAGGFTCHACGIKGDSWALIMHFEGIPKERFSEAVEWARKNVGFEDARRGRRQAAAVPYVSPWS